MCKYNIKSVFPDDMDFEDIRNIICKKIARIIIADEKEFY